jgi:adenylate cyclase
MLRRLKTVRAKLTALVALSILVMLATLPVLSWLLRRQLIDEVDDRVTDAEKAFKEELDDDLSDLTLAARILGQSGDTARALVAHDAKGVHELGTAFLDVYPELDILFVDTTGHVLAQLGCDRPPERIGDVPELAAILAGKEFRGLVEHGCEATTSGAPPAYVIATPIKDAGGVIVCIPINKPYLANTSRKLGLELAFLAPGPGGQVLQRTDGFPVAETARVTRQSTLLDSGSSTWAMARFEPPRLTSTKGGYAVIAALDVTDIKRLVEQNLLYALGVLAFAAIVSVAFGSRLASMMSGALKRVNSALKKLEQDEYVHIDALRTGDEMEDLATGFNHMVDGLKERDKLRTTIGKYMTASVMDHIMSGKVQLGGEMLQVTILFTDIRSFTTISEKMDARALVALLNEYFTEMVGIVMQEQGVVDKYIGDAIMAVFGAPVPKPDDAVHAVRAAVRMRQALVHLNARLAERGLAPLRTGIGIHTGEVVAGNIGSDRRMEYTVIGDPVNVASRLESNTKDLGVNVLISEDTYELTKHVVVARPIKALTVKGRARPVTAYEVLGLIGEPELVTVGDDEDEKAKPPALVDDGVASDPKPLVDDAA